MALSTFNDPDTLHPLPPNLRYGLLAVSIIGCFSFLMSTALFLRLSYRLIVWQRKTHTRANQFVILITNLIFADIQQSIAFLLNAEWLRKNAIDVGSPTCWAQGWFVSTGDLSSGLFTFAIAVHSYADIVHNFRLGHKTFLTAIAGIWALNYVFVVVGPFMLRSDYYVRAGAWCWINKDYTGERLWLHYFWILIAEFGSFIIYTIIVLILRRRVKESFYTTSSTELRARSAAKIIIAYPIVYIVCTLPLVTARLIGMAGGREDYTALCIAAAMITSNGWLDVLLYTLTRRGLLFGGDVPAPDASIIDTFRGRPDDGFGVTTTIESNTFGKGSTREHSRFGIKANVLGSRGVSQENLVDTKGRVIAETIIDMSRVDRLPSVRLVRLDGTGSGSDVSK